MLSVLERWAFAPLALKKAESARDRITCPTLAISHSQDASCMQSWRTAALQEFPAFNQKVVLVCWGLPWLIPPLVTPLGVNVHMNSFIPL